MTIKTQSQKKARASFESNVKKASNCRHSKCLKSCFICPEYENCDIQKRLEIARNKM